jgi:3'-phosphoadenosine 5'-phosphosulfate sulfotransferase (PAPS reductase)/FAD synthetase
MEKPVRHIMGLSGGKDSTALAVLLHKEIPEMEYFFCDTHRELPETYEYLDRIKARLGIHVEYLCAERDFDHWLTLHGGYLPSPKRRWCTEQNPKLTLTETHAVLIYDKDNQTSSLPFDLSALPSISGYRLKGLTS